MQDTQYERRKAEQLMKKILIGSAVAVCALSFGMGAASAATPPVQGCIGSTVAPAASSSPTPPGQNVVPFAQNSLTPGFGFEIQAIQTGLVPDDVALNTCNG
jgi:hypothetical protein